MRSLYEYSTPEIVRLLGERFRDYRMRRNLTQREVSQRSGIGLTTIHKFERGTARNVSLSTLIILLKTIGLIDNLDKVMPELPPSPYLLRDNDQPAQRIRHPKEK